MLQSLTQVSTAADLHAALSGSRTEEIAWIDPNVLVSGEMLAAARRAFESPDVAAATFRGQGRTLTLLGVPTLVGRGRSLTTLYAPAGLAVFHRARVVAAGGIDRFLVGGHEDANLGWRLALRGLRTVEIGQEMPTLSAPPPIAGSDRKTNAIRLRHQTANELATLFVYAGDEWLRQALPCALARTFSIAADEAGLNPDLFDFGRAIPATLPLPIEALARLLAVDDLIRHLPRLQRQRAVEQAARKVADEEVRLLMAADPVDPRWDDVAGDGARALCRMIGLGDRSGPAKAGPHSSDAPSPEPRTPSPERVSIIILTALGPKHLPDCLASLAALDYPSDAIEVIVVDNGSTEDPTAVVEHHYPGARVIRNGRNLGFCGGNNVGVAAASHDWLFFLNDDTRVDPAMLRAALETAARRKASAVGAFVVDWSGRRVDFAGGGISFDAHGFQDGIESADLTRWKQERPILFANGAAMLVRRDAYERAGGFPDPYFAYYEDVALGWALWLEGQEIWLSPEAVVFHRHHGTTTPLANAARVRNCERNACFTVLTHASEAALSDLLTATLLLAAERVVMGAGLGGMVDDPVALVNDHRLPVLERLNPKLYYDHWRMELRRKGAKRVHGVMGSLANVGWAGLLNSWRPLYVLARWGGTLAPPVADVVAVPSEWMATLAGVVDWCRQAADMEPRREALQSARQRDEHHIASKFPTNWLHPVAIEPARQAEYERAHRRVVAQFRLARFLQP